MFRQVQAQKGNLNKMRRNKNIFFEQRKHLDVDMNLFERPCHSCDRRLLLIDAYHFFEMTISLQI